jgi:hypothetical protein
MQHRLLKRHPDLFERDNPPIVMAHDQTQQLVRLVRTMLIEIVTTSSRARKEVGDDHDHA